MELFLIADNIVHVTGTPSLLGLSTYLNNHSASSIAKPVASRPPPHFNPHLLLAAHCRPQPYLTGELCFVPLLLLNQYIFQLILKSKIECFKISVYFNLCTIVKTLTNVSLHIFSFWVLSYLKDIFTNPLMVISTGTDYTTSSHVIILST